MTLAGAKKVSERAILRLEVGLMSVNHRNTIEWCN